MKLLSLPSLVNCGEQKRCQKLRCRRKYFHENGKTWGKMGAVDRGKVIPKCASLWHAVHWCQVCACRACCLLKPRPLCLHQPCLLQTKYFKRKHERRSPVRCHRVMTLTSYSTLYQLLSSNQRILDTLYNSLKICWLTLSKEVEAY